MAWLLHRTAGSVDLALNRAAIDALQRLAQRLAAGRPIAGQSGLADLLLAATTDSDAADAAAQLIDAPAAAAWRALLRATDTATAAALASLVCPVGAVGTTGCPGSRRLLTWPVLSRSDGVPTPAAAADPVPIDDLTLTLNAAFDVEVDPPLDLLPTLIDAEHVVRLGLAGTVQAKVGLTAPLPIGGLAIGTDGEAGTKLDYFSAARGDDVLADALGAALGDLPSPFDLLALSTRLNAGPLRALRLDARVSSTVVSSIAVGLPLDLLNGTLATLSIEAATNAARRDRLLLVVRGEQVHPEPSVILDLERDDLALSADAIQTGIEIDPAPALRRLAPGLIRYTGKAEAWLAPFASLLPPSRLVEGPIARALAGIDPGALTDAGLDSALGGAQGRRLVGLLLRGIDTDGRIWVEDGARLGAELAGRATLQAGLPGSSAEAVGAVVSPVVADAIRQLQQRFDALLPRVHAHGRPAAASQRNVALARLRDYQGFLTRLGSALQRAGAAKIGARLRHTMQHTSHQGLRQRLRLFPIRAGAQLLFERIATGAIDAAQIMAEADGDAAGHRPAQTLGGGLTAEASLDETNGSEIALLDIVLSQASILDADIAIDVDQAGNLSVFSRTESRRDSKGIGESDSVRAVNVFELAGIGAGASRRMTFSLSVSHRDERFEDAEVMTFFAALEAERLLPADSGAQALALLDREADASLKRRGELRVWLELAGPDLLRLLQIPPSATDLAAAPLDDASIYAAAVAAIVAAHGRTGSRTTLRNLRHFIGSAGLGQDLEPVLIRLRDRAFRASLKPLGESSGFGDDSEEFRLLVAMSDRALALVDLIAAMRELYFAPRGRQGPRWTEQDYLARQRLLDAKTAFWLRGEPFDRGFRAFTSEALRPYTLAFFLVLSRLATATATPIALLASVFIQEGDVGREIRLVAGPLSAAGGAPDPELPGMTESGARSPNG